MTMSTISILLVACAAVAVVQGQEENFQLSYIAEKMNQYCSLRGGMAEHHRVVHNVSASRVGKAGPRGPPGVVNYTMVKAFIEETVERKMKILRDEISAFRSQANRTKTRNPELCKVSYGEKCFWAIPTTKQKFKALALCEKKGGQAANIYSSTHFEAMREYLASVASDSDDYFTGMKYNPARKAVTFRDGSDATFVKWYFEAPYSGDDSAVIMFDFYSSASTAGFWNFVGIGGQEGVLCEIQS